MESASFASRRVSHGVEVLARMGYAAKGFVYVIVGGLSALAAFRLGGDGAQGSRAALGSLRDEPYGTALLIAVAVGIAGYVVWRLVQAVKDPEGHGTDAKGLVVRAGMLVSAFVYGGLAVWVVRTLTGNGSTGGGGGGGGGDSADTWSAWLLQQPYGQWLLGAVGVILVGYGVVEWGRAYRSRFEKRMRTDLDVGKRRVLRRVARTGLIARGIVFWIMGAFVVTAAVQSDPSEARGLEGALTTLGEQAYGPWLMGLVALGLVAYGLFQFAKAWYRRIGVAR